MKNKNKYDFIVIGGGIIGMQCAWQIHLSNPGKKIAVIDKNPQAYDNASCGNMAGFPFPGVSVDNLLLFPDDEFVATPMHMGLRVGGTVELAGLDAPPDYRRTDTLAENIRLYFPEINTEGRTEWMGHRPSMPDGLPIISQSSRHKKIYYAFGHGHVGVTQSAITGKIIVDLVANKIPDFDISPFSVARH